jgi:hypothetical protein
MNAIVNSFKKLSSFRLLSSNCTPSPLSGANNTIITIWKRAHTLCRSIQTNHHISSASTRPTTMRRASPARQQHSLHHQKHSVTYNGNGDKSACCGGWWWWLVRADWVASAAAARYLQCELHGQTLRPAQNVLFPRIMLLLSQVAEGRECVRLVHSKSAIPPKWNLLKPLCQFPPGSMHH